MAAQREERAGQERTSAACRVALVVAVRLYREGIELALGQAADFDVAAVTGEPDVEALLASAPDLLVLDVETPGNLEVARMIADRPGAPRIVALALHESEEAVIRCAEAGVFAYVPREASLDELAGALRRAMRGEARCPPRIAGGLMRRVAALSAERPGFPQGSPLTAREEEVVVLIDEGLSNKEIARRLFIEVATVKNHVHNILEKLKVTRRAQAAARMRAVRRGAV